MPRSIVALVILQIVTALAVSFGVVEREAVFFVTAMLLLFIALVLIAANYVITKFAIRYHDMKFHHHGDTHSEEKPDDAHHNNVV